jgi:hypothetical protein
VLAYVFWHTPREADLERYERGLAAFHRALSADPPDGFDSSWSVRVEWPAWLPAGPAHYLDWYVVEGFAALGALNEGAVSGRRQLPHDAVAALAGAGTAGVASHLAGPVTPLGATSSAVRPRAGPGTAAAGAGVGTTLVVTMIDKPLGQTYSTFRQAFAGAAPGASCWERQLTLGPGAEYILLHDRVLELPWPATVLSAFAL